jgi:hypothetical protein
MAGTNERLLLQYKASTDLMALFYALVDTPYLVCSASFQQLYTRLDIDLSVGRQLDLIGTIVNQARPDSFVDDPILSANSFTWDTTDPNKYWNEGIWGGVDLRVAMSDPDYRKLLKGVIFSQNSLPTIYNIEQFGKFAFGNPFRVRAFIGSVEVVSPYELSPSAINIAKGVINVAQGIRLDLFMGVPQSLGEIFELDSSDLTRSFDQGYWAIKV